MRFSPSTGCCYPESIPYPQLPDDLVSFSDKLYQQWMANPGSNLVLIDGAVKFVARTKPTLDDARTDQIALINAAYANALTAPVSYTTIAGATATFPQTDQAKQYLAQCLANGSAAWKINLWLDIGGMPVSPFTFADLQALSAAMAAADAPAYHDLLTAIASVNAAPTLSKIRAITL